MSVYSLAPLTPAQIQAQANIRTNAAMAPQQAAIQQERAHAAKLALANQMAISQSGAAAAKLMQEGAANTGTAYNSASKSLTDMASGFSAQMAAQMRATHAANAGILGAAGAPAGGFPGEDAAGAQNAMFDIGGHIPGAALLEQGAAARTAAE